MVYSINTNLARLVNSVVQANYILTGFLSTFCIYYYVMTVGIFILVDLPVSSFSYISFCFIYFEGSLLSA